MPTVSSPRSASNTTSWVEILFDGSTYYPMGGNPTVNVQANWMDTVTYGENIKGWRELLRNGDNATTSLTGRRSAVRVRNGRFEFRSDIGVVRKSTLVGAPSVSLDPPGPPDSLSQASSDLQALGEFATKVNMARSAVQGGVFLGELGQTLRMIKSPAQGLRRLVTDWHREAALIRQGHRVGSLASRMRRVAENLGDAWLEHAFGWKPLLSDIDGGCKALAESYVGRPLQTKRVTASAQTRVSYSPEASAIYSQGLATWKVTTRYVGLVQTIYRGAVRIEASDPKTMDPALFGFTPEQFLPTAWELVPYSFLIDYFTNIGDIINGWSSLLVPLKWCNRTVRKTNQTTRISDTNKGLAGYGYYSSSPAVVIGETTLVSRAKYSGTTVPDFTFKMPGSGSLRWLNLAALIASRKSDRSWTFD